MPKKKMIGETQIKPEEIIIYLTPIDAELFRAFREHQTEFMVLKNTGIFDLKSGSMTIHKDHQGVVRQIDSHQVLFKI